MANDGKTLEKLYLELGLDISRLQADILAADKTVTENLGRINRAQNTIKLRVEADTAALDRVKDAVQIFEIQERGLNQQLSLSRDKLAILEAAYRQVANNSNSTALAVQRAEQAFQKQRIEVARLEAQLKSLSAQKISFDTAQLQEKISQINSRIQHVRIQADIDVSKLQGANTAFDAQKIHIAAVTREIELQRQKLIQLQETMYRSAKNSGVDSVQTLNIKSNVLQQIQEITRLENRLKELQGRNINLQIRADSIRQAEQTINESIARINAKVEHIRVKTDIDVSKLGAAASEFDKAKAHVQGLNRELDLQNQKLAELKKALGASVSANGLNNVKTINLQTEIQKQIQAIDQLKAKINELNKIEPSKSGGLLSGYLNIKGDAISKLNEFTLAFSNLNGATSSADGAIVSVLSVIDSIPRPAAAATAALLGVPILFKAIENSILDMTRAVAASGDAVYVMSRGFQMSIADTGKFSTSAKVAGVQVNDLAQAVKFVQRQIARGGEDSRAAEWLKRYGESAYNASGSLKNLNEMTFSLSNALKKAQADGKGAEFVMNVFRNVSADAITAIEDWADVNAQAATIVKAGLANPKLAHEVQGNLNAMNVQSAQLGTSFTNALLPVANEIVPRMTERMGKMTQIIKDNKDVILAFGRDFAEVWGSVEAGMDKVIDGVGVLAELARENRVVRQTDTKSVVERYIDDSSVQNAEDLVKKEIAADGYTDEDVKKLRSRTDLYKKEVKTAEADMKALWAKRRELFAEDEHIKPILDKYKYDTSIKNATDLLNELTAEEKKTIEQTDSTFGSMKARAGALYLELQKIRQATEQTKNEFKKLKSVADEFSTAGAERGDLNEDRINLLRETRKYEENAKTILYKLNHSAYENQKYGLQQWIEEQLPRDAEHSLEKYNAVMEEAAARSAQIERDRATKLAEIRDSVAAADRSALENKLASIEREREAWVDAGMSMAEATKLARQKIAQAYEESEAKTREHARNAADIEYEMTHTAFEKQLRDIEHWKEAQLDKADTAKEAAAIVAEAAAKEAQAFEREVDKIKGRVQSLDDKIFNLDHSQYEQDMRRIKQEYWRGVQEFQAMGAYTPEIADKLNYLYNRQAKNFFRRAAESSAKNGDYTKRPDGSYGAVMSVPLLADTSEIEALLYSKLNANAQAEVNKIRGLDSVQQDLEQFGSAVQQTAGDLKSFDELKSAAKSAAGEQKTLAERTKILNESLKSLADVQKDLAGAIKKSVEKNQPTDELTFEQKIKKSALKISGLQPEAEDGVLKILDSSQKASGAQYYINRIQPSINRALEELGILPSEKNSQKDSGFNFDVFKNMFSAREDINSKAMPETSPGSIDEKLQVLQQQISDRAAIDFSEIVMPLSSIGENVQGILQAIQDSQPDEDDKFKEYFGVLPNIEDGVNSILLELQKEEESGLTESLGALPKISEAVQGILQSLQNTKDFSAEMPNTPAEMGTYQMPEIQSAPTDYLTGLTNIDGKLQSILQAVQEPHPVTFETVITPLDSIKTLVSQIVTALGNRQPAQITVSPNNNINLGGAYVFDNTLKQELVNDITSKIVDQITTSVQQAVSRSSYGFSA